MAESKTPRMSARIYNDILSRIVEGEFKAGSILPTEHALAEHFATSRPTVREALAQLRADGMIATRRGSGSLVVRRPDPDIRHFAPLETLSDIRRCYDFRSVIESRAAALAAQYATEADIAAIERGCSQLAVGVESSGTGANDDFAFHMAVARASKNQFFVTALSAIQEQMLFSMNLSLNLSRMKSVERLQLVQREHRALLEAIQQRDARRAEQAARDHLERAMERMFGL